MFVVNARSVASPDGRFAAARVERRALGPRDVLIDIAYAGICHSDIDHVRNLRGRSTYPLVPGHEIAGTVTAVGTSVTRFVVGDHVGVGNMVNTCGACSSCRSGLEQYCSGGRVMTYNSVDRDGQPTHGGYSEKIVVDEAFAVRIPDAVPLARAAPLLCAGISLYSPLRHWRAGPGKRVGIVGLGGLGHLGVQLSKAMGAHTTVFDVSPAKRADAQRLGADEFRLANTADALVDIADSMDLIVSTVPSSVDVNRYLALLAVDGTYVSLGVPPTPLNVDPYTLLRNRRSIAGTLSGGMRETQEMIEFCARHGIGAEVEIIDADGIDAAFERLLAGDVRFRFVIDISTMAAA